MACENIVGIKNILLTFFDCDTDTRIGPISHVLSSEELPTVKACSFTTERMTNGFTKRVSGDASMSMSIIRDLRVPLAFYQGCTAVTAQLEYENGIVMTGVDGGVVGDTESDTHEVSLEIVYEEVDELLPPGSLAQVA